MNQKQKNVQWNTLLKQAHSTTDALGQKIDEGILETVVALNAHKLFTAASCEGHITGNPFPWIHIEAPETDEIINCTEKEKNLLLSKNLQLQRAYLHLLDDFYKSRLTSSDLRLGLRYIGVFGGFRIQSMGAELSNIRTKKEKMIKLAEYQNEMKDFTTFLKKQFFNS